MKRQCGSNVETFLNERPDRSNMSPEESLHKPALPVKPPRVAQGKLQNVGNDVHESHTNSGGHQTDFQGYNMSGSDRDELAMPGPLIAQHINEPNFVSSTRFRGKRNQRGLCSKSDLPNVTDNRYYFLNRQERSPGEKLTTNGTARNYYTGTTYQNRTVPQSVPQELQSSKMTREHQMFPKGTHSYEWDDAFEEGMYNERTGDIHERSDQVFYNTNAVGQEEAARRQERHLQNRAIPSEQGVTNWRTENNPRRNDQSFDNTNPSVQKDARRSDWHSQNSENQSEQGMTHWRADNFPQHSQFHKETKTYPRSTEGYPFTGHRQSPHTYRSFREPNNSYDSRDQNYSYRYHKPTSSSRSSHNAWHSGRPSTQFDNDGFYDDPYADDLEEFDDLDDVPAYDDIPYALIMTGSVDEKTLKRAKRKQMQLMELDLIKGKAGKSKAGEKVNKNKNQGNFATKSSGTRIDTYKEQLLSGRTKHTAEVLQSSGRNNGESNDAASGNELSQKESIYPGNTNAHKNAKENDCNETSRPPDEEINPSRAEKTELDNAMKTAMKPNYNETGDFEKRKRRIERSQSPVHVSDKQEDRAASFGTKSNMELVSKEEKKSVNECREKQRLETETERYVREKRLEKLKAKEISSANKATEISHTHKPDNREVAFHSDIVHKPVKSTAFRSKLPNFRSDTAPQEKNVADSEASARGINPEDTSLSKTKSSLSTSNGTIDTKSDEQPLAMQFVQKKAEPNAKKLPQNTSKLTGDTQNNSVNVPVLKGTSKDSRTYDIEGDKEISDEETEPTAMKFLRQGKMKRSGYFRKTESLVDADDNDEEMIEPSAMRLLRQSKGRSEIKETKEGGLSQTGFSKTSGIPSSLLATLGLTVMFGGMPGESMKGKMGSALIISDGISSAAKPKQVKKNKNKNMSPLVQKGQELSAREEEPVEDTGSSLLYVFEDDEQSDHVKGTDDKSSQIASVSGVTSMQTFTMQPVTIFKVADKRHKAFQKMKMSQSADYLKCTSCGRPECQGHNIKKMKEIIRIAKQAGFEVRDVTPDGNCMFAAVVDQLELYGDYSFGPKSLREASVSWLIEHPCSDDGTHYSSFLSEEWDVYLQRMMAEGEWGDHLILRAIVETIGHTIKVLNVSGEESHWTILEPERIDVSKDGMHLVLGHVGEFHYTSLRPAADGETSSFVPVPMSPTSQGLSIADEDGQIALEGTETVEMFREDYIDTWSDMPAAHFSYLLKCIIPVKVVNTAAIYQSQYTDSFSAALKIVDSSSGIVIESEYGGSLMEGVYVPNLNATINADSSVSENVEVEMYGILKDLVIVAQKSEDLRSREKECVIDTNGVHAGYTKLLCIRRFSEGQEEYSKYQRQIKMCAQSEENDPHQYCCRNHIHLKRFSALRCPVWPECGKSWVSRVRREGWPTKEIISSIESDGCLLLPNAHKESKCPDLEWQFSFTLCEKKLFNDASSLYQKYCYILFGALCTQTMCHLQSISSAHIKSVFFYACERIPAEFWESSPGACVLYMLDELLRYVRSKNLPNYFISANNMIDHLKEKDFKEIEEQIILLRSQPVLFLRQINESLKLLPHGNTIIDKVSDDIPNFKAHKSLKMSTLEVFIPATIDTAHVYIRNRYFEEGYELLSQAFQQRLSVSTCDDSVPFQIFLQGAVSGLDLDSLVWFSAFTDKHLEGQLSKSLVRETCGDLPLVRIKDILPADVVGSFGNTEVPVDFSTRMCSFCHDFAKFLFRSNKLSEILPILYHCHGIFVKKLEDAKSTQAAYGRSGEQQADEDFTDEAMFDIYTAMYTVYKKQQQVEFFRTVMPVVHAIVERIKTRWAYNCLCYMYQDLRDEANLNTSDSVYNQLPEDPMEQTRLAAFLYWPFKVKPVAYM